LKLGVHTQIMECGGSTPLFSVVVFLTVRKLDNRFPVFPQQVTIDRIKSH
jgi:hypothetical protein